MLPNFDHLPPRLRRTCGHGDWSTPSFRSHLHPIPTGWWQIMPTICWCPIHVMKALELLMHLRGLYFLNIYYSSRTYFFLLILGCDLVGFHTEDYCLNFVDCCQRILVRSMSFYPDFIQILFRFYPDFIQILSRLYPDFIQILSRFYPDYL